MSTHKVFISSVGRKTKLVFADNTFVYSTVSDWASSNSGLDFRKSIWSEEPKSFLDSEKTRLSTFEPFITEASIG